MQTRSPQKRLQGLLFQCLVSVNPSHAAFGCLALISSFRCTRSAALKEVQQLLEPRCNLHLSLWRMFLCELKLYLSTFQVESSSARGGFGSFAAVLLLVTSAIKTRPLVMPRGNRAGDPANKRLQKTVVLRSTSFLVNVRIWAFIMSEEAFC